MNDAKTEAQIIGAGTEAQMTDVKTEAQMIGAYAEAQDWNSNDWDRDWILNEWGQYWRSCNCANSCEAETEAQMSNDAKIEARMIAIDAEAWIERLKTEAWYEWGQEWAQISVAEPKSRVRPD